MATTKLISGFQKDLPLYIASKTKLVFDEKEIDSKPMEELKFALKTDSTGRVVEFVFYSLALSELKGKKSIYEFPAYDYAQNLQKLVEKLDSKNLCELFLPTWVIIATSKIVKNKVNKFQFTSIEEVLNILIEVMLFKRQLSAVIETHRHQRKIFQKIKLVFDEKKLRKEMLDKLNLVFSSSSPKRIVELVFYTLALSELNQQRRIDAIDFFKEMENFEKLAGANSKNSHTIHIPVWIIMTALEVLKERDSELKLTSLEKIIDAALSLTVEHTKVLWSSEV